MKLYIALSYSVSSDLKGCGDNMDNFLASYWAIISQRRGIISLQKRGQKFFLDSGAFSAFTKNIEIPIDDYIQFIKTNQNIIEQYASLDVIGDWKKTKENCDYMESKGLSPIPTFHFGSPLEELVRLVKEYDYVALGGLVPLSLNKKKMRWWLDKCWKVIFENSLGQNKPLIKMHGFGVNAIWLMKQYPWYSLDATSWKQPNQYGRMAIFNDGKIKGIGKSKSTNFLSLRMNKYDRLKGKKKTQEYWDLASIQIREINKMTNYITRLWEKKGVKWD